jgi:AraC-like DNA-binding protein
MATHRKKEPRRITHWHRQGWSRAVEHYLHDCYRRKKPAREKDFARSLDLTPEYASSLATQALGESLQQFMRKKQVEHAARLLRRKIPLSVEEIAARSAFGTRSAMHRWFVKVYGAGPAAFRERNR